jgi:hypothetical protein
MDFSVVYALFWTVALSRWNHFATRSSAMRYLRVEVPSQLGSDEPASDGYRAIYNGTSV